ncbi:MAG: glycoside hydrolase family 16 protein [Cytophagales bacterium]
MKYSLFKEYIFLVFFLTLNMACSDDETVPAAVEPITENDSTETSWDLIFEEDFENNLVKWNIWEGGAFNEEIQLYREEQLSIADGKLSIKSKREAITGFEHPWSNNSKQFEYVSGRIESKTLFSPSDNEGEREYRFVASIKLPQGHGMWPAFWTYGDPWPTKGEIDILEARGGEPYMFQTNIFYGTETDININSNNDLEHIPGPDLTADFHSYEMIWKADSIDILFDDSLLYSYAANSNNNIGNFYGSDQKIVLNTAVGGFFFFDRNSANYADSSEMLVDWVRVFKR